MTALSFGKLLEIQLYYIGETPLLFFLSLFLPLLLSRQMRQSTSELAAAAEHHDSRNDDHYPHYRYHYYSC